MELKDLFAKFNITNYLNLTGNELVELSKMDSMTSLEVSSKLMDEYDTFYVSGGLKSVQNLKNILSVEEVYWFSNNSEDEKYIEYGFSNIHNDCDEFLATACFESQYVLKSLMDLISYSCKLVIETKEVITLSLGFGKNVINVVIDEEGILIPNDVDKIVIKTKKDNELRYYLYMLGIYLGEYKLSDLLDLGIDLVCLD